MKPRSRNLVVAACILLGITVMTLSYIFAPDRTKDKSGAKTTSQPARGSESTPPASVAPETTSPAQSG